MERVLKYQKIESYMLQQLSSGRFARNDRFFAEVDIAARFGVTVLTARKAFAQLESKGYIVRRRGLGTFVTALPERPQRLKMIKRCIIGIVIGDSSLDNNLKLGRLLIALHRAIEQAGYLSLLVGDDFEPLLEAEVNGVVVLDRIGGGRARKLLQSGIPAVGFYPDAGGIPGLAFDYVQAAEEVVNCFRTHGAGHLAMVGEGDDARTVRNLFEKPLATAAERAGMRLSIAVPPLGSVYDELVALLEQPERPDALWVLNSWSLGAVTAALKERNLRIGREVSVLVHGSNALLIPSSPAYSIIDLDIEDAVRKIMELLLRQIRDPQAELPKVSARYAAVVDRGSLAGGSAE